MVIAFKIALCFVMAVLSAGLAEALFHKWLFHSKMKWVPKITKMWDYNPSKHTDHHRLCYKHLEDKENDVDTYWIQRPTNVFAAWVVTCLVQSAILLLIGFSWHYLVLMAVLNVATFAFWYKFEDHFHVGMHKPEYYMKYIHNTWQDSWFKYCKDLHEIHHKNANLNFGFIYFPIGDLLLGTYCKNYDKKKSKSQAASKSSVIEKEFEEDI